MKKNKVSTFQSRLQEDLRDSEFKSELIRKPSVIHETFFFT